MKTTWLNVMVTLLLLLQVGSSELLAAAAADSPTFFKWNANPGLMPGAKFEKKDDTASYEANAIRIMGGGTKGSASTLDYMTGGESSIFDAEALASAQAQRAPDHLVENQREGDVVVRIFAFKGQDIERARDFARRVAKALHMATTQVLPGKLTSVQADIYVMPKGAAYSLARKIQWKTGRPLEIVIFIPAGSIEDSLDLATHELFHVLAAQQRPRLWFDTRMGRPNAASAYEEVAANLFASCGALLADGYLLRPSVNPDISYVINDVPMRPPLTSEQVKQIVAGLRTLDAKPQGTRQGTELGHFLDSTPVFHVFESGQERIELHSSQGAKLLGICRDLLPDPMNIERWLEGL